ncbi:HPP family protein [Candidatus Marsarchaeota archaeon]|jgi:CBS-domain-containing membrane protein|nr:HPP family protein [Candidatus Marsarchaeota archaeon]
MEKEYRYREPKSVKEAWKRLKHRIVPAILAGLALALLVFLLQYFDIDKAYGLGTSAVIFTSFASSIYIMFITPNSRAAKNSKFVKSYTIAGIVGSIGGLGLAVMPLYVVAALVIFFVSVLMIITKSEHPPAAAIAFAFVLFRIGVIGIIIIASGVIIVVTLRYLLEKTTFEVEREMLKVSLREKQKSIGLQNSKNARHKRRR